MKNNEKLIQIFRETFDDPNLEVTDDVSPGNYELWDSVETINLVMSVEREFGIRLSIDEVASLKDFGKLRMLVEKHAQ